MPIKKNESLYGDSALYFGMLAYLDRKKWGSDLAACQNKLSGRLMRNPEDAPAHTSRDMMIGFLLGCTQGEALKLREYCKQNKWRLSPESPDSRNIVWFSGRIQLSMAARKGWERFLYWTLPLTHMIEMLTAWKEFQFHLVMVSALFFEKYKKRTWMLKLLWRVAAIRSPKNPIVLFATKDLNALNKTIHAVQYELYHDEECTYKDHWSPASFEFWRANRMSHPAVLSWCQAAARKLRGKKQDGEL